MVLCCTSLPSVDTVHVMLYLKDGLDREEELVSANLLLVSDAVEIALYRPGFARSTVKS